MMELSGDSETLDGNVESLSIGIESLIEQAEKEEQKLKSLYDLLDNIEVTCAGENPDVSVLQSKYAMLKAELMELKDHEVEGIPLNKDLQVALLKQHMEQNIAGLKDFSEYMDFTKAKLIKKRQKLQAFLTIEKEVISYPTGIEENQLEVTPVSLAKEKTAELKGKIKKMKTLNELRVCQLRILLERLYTQPDSLIIAEIEKEDMNYNNESDVEKKSLLQIIELLMNASLVSSNPWITVDSTMWYPYIEFLSRSRIIVRDPSNDNLIKLEKFHE